MSSVPRPRGVSPAFHEALMSQVDSGSLDLPVLEEAAARVIAITTDPNSELEQAARAIEQAPDLAARILGIAASALYATQEPAHDVETAAKRLGLRTVGELAIAALVRDRLYQPSVGAEREIEHLWQRSAVAGIYCYRLTLLRGRASEATILAGLLAHIGKPVVVGILAELEACLGERLELATRRTLIDALHVAIGAALVRSWSLPQSVVLAVTFQRAFHQAPAGNQDAAIACLCNELAERLFLGGAPTSILDHPAARALGLSEDELDQLLEDPEELIEASRALG